MNTRRTGQVPVVLALALSLAAPAFAQAPAVEKPFEPQVGQPGKDVVWVPTPEALVDKMLDMANVTPADFVMDLGSGDGRTVIAAAKRGARAVGVEYNPDMVALSKQNAAAAGVSDRATFMQADIFETDFSMAQVITMFLLPSINMKLRPKILGLKPGTRIVSNTFTMEDWAADEMATVTPADCPNGSWCTALFWVVPANVAGTWSTSNGELTLTQQFQVITGTLGTATVLGRLRGNRITFTSGATEYVGTVNGNAIEGVAPRAWTATKKM